MIKVQTLYNLVNVFNKKSNENPYLSVSCVVLKFDVSIKTKV